MDAVPAARILEPFPAPVLLKGTVILLALVAPCFVLTAGRRSFPAATAAPAR